jgi:hypothetical protein
MFWDGISSIPDESYTAVTRSSLPRLWEQGIPREGEDDCWVGEDTLQRLYKKHRDCKETNFNHSFGQDTGIQTKMVATCKQNAS